MVGLAEILERGPCWVLDSVGLLCLGLEEQVGQAAEDLFSEVEAALALEVVEGWWEFAFFEVRPAFCLFS